jgi:hypothetical protein
MPNAHARMHAGMEPHVHAPALQPSPCIPQSRPQLPQLLGSVCVFTQVLPPQHSWPAPQLRPHAPQLAAVSTRVHTSPQHIWPDGQLPPHGAVLTQRPIRQASPVAQGRPQPPQWSVLVVVSTQPPLQHVCVPVHAAPAPQ